MPYIDQYTGVKYNKICEDGSTSRIEVEYIQVYTNYYFPVTVIEVDKENQISQLWLVWSKAFDQEKEWKKDLESKTVWHRHK